MYICREGASESIACRPYGCWAHITVLAVLSLDAYGTRWNLALSPSFSGFYLRSLPCSPGILVCARP